MQDEVRQKSVAFVIQCGKITAEILKMAIRQYLQQRNKNKQPQGKQRLKQLVRQGQGVTNIEITDKNIKSFEYVARKYGIDFALKKALFTAPPKYLVFFKAKDTDALNAAFQEFTAKTLKKQEKPSILQKLAKYQQAVRQQPDHEKDRSRGAH